MIRRLLVCGALLGFLAAVGCDGGNTPDPKIQTKDAPQLQKQMPNGGGAPAPGGNPAPGGKPPTSGAKSE